MKTSKQVCISLVIGLLLTIVSSLHVKKIPGSKGIPGCDFCDAFIGTVYYYRGFPLEHYTVESSGQNGQIQLANLVGNVLIYSTLSFVVLVAISRSKLSRR